MRTVDTTSADESRVAGTVGNEAAHAGLLVRGGEQGGEVQPFEFEASCQPCIGAAVDGVLGGA